MGGWGTTPPCFFVSGTAEGAGWVRGDHLRILASVVALTVR